MDNIVFAEAGLYTDLVTIQTIMENRILVISEGKAYVSIDLEDIPRLIEMLQLVQANPEAYDIGDEYDIDDDDDD